MHSTCLLTSIVLVISTTFAASETAVHNKCDFDLWYAPVDSNPPTKMIPLPSHTYITQDQWFDGNTGTALKITKTEDGLWTGAPVLNFGYTIKDGVTWYDLSTINGFDFSGKKITLIGDQEGSEQIIWDGAEGPVKIAHWSGDIDLSLTICAS